MVPLSADVFAGGIVNLTVGEAEVPFDAHIELLCAKSTFFDNALKGRFLEAETKHIPLPDDDPATFAELLSWMYSEHISLEGKSPSWFDLCKLWVMADKYHVSGLQNRIIELCSKKYVSKPPGHKGNIHQLVLSYVYDNTMPQSPLRNVIRDICVWGMDVEKFAKFKHEFPKEFLEDYALQQTRRARAIAGDVPPIQTHPAGYFVPGPVNIDSNEALALKSKDRELNDEAEQTDQQSSSPHHGRRMKLPVRRISSRFGPSSPLSQATTISAGSSADESAGTPSST